MKLRDILILGFAAAFFIIGIDQTIKLGFAHAYWAVMTGLILFFIYGLQKRRDASQQKTGRSSNIKKSKTTFRSHR